MEFGSTFFVFAALIIVIWVFVEIKRLKHKIFAIFLIVLIIFTYVSFSISVSDQNIDLKTVPGILKAGKLYFSWLGTLFSNAKSITAYAAKQDWKDYNVSLNDTSKAEDVWNKLKDGAEEIKDSVKSEN